MHEGHFTEQIVQAIFDQMKSHPGGRARRIRLKVGETHHLEPASVQEHFKVLARGTALEGAVLELEEEKMTLTCLDCGWSGEAQDHHFRCCGSCSSVRVKVNSGEAVTLETIELES